MIKPDLTMTIGAKTYPLFPLAALDAHLKTCPEHHRDRLLDAQLLLYVDGRLRAEALVEAS